MAIRAPDGANKVDIKYDADYDTTFAQVSPMKNGNRLVISLADYKMDDGRYTCQVQRIILGIKNSQTQARIKIHK